MQIIQVNLTSLDPQPLKSGTALEFTFSVEWEANTIPFARRFERYLDYSFFEHQVRDLVQQVRRECSCGWCRTGTSHGA